MPKKLTQEEFIRKCKDIHPEYLYEKSIYNGANNPVTVTCPIHGDFQTRPNRFIMGAKCGCPKCNTGFIKYLSPEQFLSRCKEHFPNYDYSKAVFKGEYDKIVVTCPKHNYTWSVITKSLMTGHGCPICGKEHSQEKQSLTTQEFIEKAKQVHDDRYDYSKVDYYNITTPVTIICPIHGEFKQSPSSHLYQKSGCPKCKQSKGEREVEQFLKENKITFIYQYSIKYSLNKKGKTYIDFYLPDYNIFIEYNGMQHYIPIKHFGGELKFYEQVQRDSYVRNYCKENNIKLIEIKYNDNVASKLRQLLGK